MVKTLCYNLSIITAIFFGVRIFRSLTLLVLLVCFSGFFVPLVGYDLKRHFLVILLYCKTPKTSDTIENYCKDPKIWPIWIFHRVVCPKDADGNANDQEQSDLGLHCLFRPVYLITVIFSKKNHRAQSSYRSHLNRNAIQEQKHIICKFSFRCQN